MRRGMIVGSVAAAVLLSGCGVPPWEKDAVPAANPAPGLPSLPGLPSFPSPPETPAAPSPTPTATPPAPLVAPAPRPTRTPPMVVDDLADGSSHRQFRAGALVVTADYWSTRGKAEWTPQAVKPLTLSVSADGSGDIKLTALTVQVERLTVDGWVAVAPDAITQPVVSDAPGVKAPASAGATVVIGAVEEDSSALRYTLSYTLTSSSKYNSFQAVGNDTLTVGLAGVR